MTIRSIAEFRVRPGEAERFEDAYRRGRFLERAVTNPGFIRGELLRSAEDPDVFVVVAEWRSEDDYRAWQAAYHTLPQNHSSAMLATLVDAPRSMVARPLLAADRSTTIAPVDPEQERPQ
ncbi:MAG: antibiotic biosynthesis monooxygenase family protein [Actinomycetota bacterium]